MGCSPAYRKACPQRAGFQAQGEGEGGSVELGKAVTEGEVRGDAEFSRSNFLSNVDIFAAMSIHLAYTTHLS